MLYPNTCIEAISWERIKQDGRVITLEDFNHDVVDGVSSMLAIRVARGYSCSPPHQVLLQKKRAFTTFIHQLNVFKPPVLCL